MAQSCIPNCNILVFALLNKVRELEQQVQFLQSRCRHVFVETSESDERICLSCSYTESIICRLPGD
ncbi:hypothetical protein ACFFJY_02160 [Fictibacillus aquaticus]|uniref:Uncharacterized protein n=1 Tax=Fictibacillus aquaticus TaxID=2021314 RepID=A0A235F836_9BACL|nr:hypothetical protein [Fictibacillus aquaticus]OYD57511.1 hypothetical protein CGZ90_12615 [Fictibacillus aquaticus]